MVESLYSLSRLWLNKGDKQRAERYMREAEELFETYKETISSPSAEAGLLAHRQVLNYALHSNYQMMPLATYNVRWQDKDYIRYRVAEAKERSMSDLREQVLRQKLAKQRQMVLLVGLVCVVLGLCLLLVCLYRRRQRLLLEKEEEIETLRNMLASADKSDDRFRNNRSSESEIRTGASQPADGSVRKLMLQQLGVIKTIAGTPTEANRVLVFSQFTSFLTMAQNSLSSNSPKDGPISFYLDGSTPLAKRKQMVERFQKGEAQVFFISLKAGGLGLNLTGANYVIHLDPWWNPAIEQQATDRAYRIGQRRNVTVYHLIAADTIEEKILRLHKNKRDLADALLQDQNTAQTLTLDDLKMLLKR